MDRNFPGVPRIKAMLATGTHVLIRVKDGITLRRAGDFLPDGSYLADDLRRRDHADRPGDRVHRHRRRPGRPRAVLPDHRPARPRRLPGPACSPQAYHWRWIGSETCLKEAKSAISGAGPSTGPMLRSASPALIRQEHAAWVTAVELARAVARAAAAVAIPARKGTPRRAARAPPADLLHRRPPGRHRLRPVRRGHRQPARRPHRGEPGRASWPAWPGAASRSTGTGTATARPRPGRASRPAGRAWPPAPRQPRSASASP